MVPTEANAVENTHREGVLIMPVSIQNSLHLNVAHLSTSNDGIDKMAISHSRCSSVKWLVTKRLLIHGLVHGTDSPEFAVMEILKSFEVAFL